MDDVWGAYKPSLKVQTAPFGRCWNALGFGEIFFQVFFWKHVTTIFSGRWIQVAHIFFNWVVQVPPTGSFYLIALKPGNCWQILTPALPQRPPIHMKSLRFWQFRFPWWGFFLYDNSWLIFVRYWYCWVNFLKRTGIKNRFNGNFKISLPADIWIKRYRNRSIMCETSCATSQLKTIQNLRMNKNQLSFPIWFHRSDGESRTFEAFARTRGWKGNISGCSKLWALWVYEGLYNMHF